MAGWQWFLLTEEIGPPGGGQLWGVPARRPSAPCSLSLLDTWAGDGGSEHTLSPLTWMPQVHT